MGTIHESAGTGKPLPENHLGTSDTTWRGTLPADQIARLVDALQGRDRPARWKVEGEERSGLATVRVTMHVHWRQPSRRSVGQHVFVVRRDLVGRMEARTDARFESQPVHAEFVTA
jgi:hypothetical protein